MLNMFKRGDIVLHCLHDTCKLGEVKSVKSSGDLYYVRYHSGDTATLTEEALLQPIDNIDAFQVIRKDVNNDIQTQKARRIANKILETIAPPLKGSSYYKYEDMITKILEEYKEENNG